MTELKRIHVSLREEDFVKLTNLYPERGVLQHLIRRFLRGLLSGSTVDEVTTSIKMKGA